VAALSFPAAVSRNDRRLKALIARSGSDGH
jgi:hypothetical protein